MSAASMETKQFILWKPGYVDAVRKYFISENFQGAVQLTLGLLFVSLFVFVRSGRSSSSSSTTGSSIFMFTNMSRALLNRTYPCCILRCACSATSSRAPDALS